MSQNSHRWPKRMLNIVRVGLVRRGWIPGCCGLLLFLLAVIYIPLQQQQRRKPPTQKKRSSINPDGEFLMAHEFLPSIQEETLQFMEQIDPATSLVTSTNSSSSASKEIPIDEVHVKGLVHFGAWIFVTDVTNQKVLLLKRGPQLVTCPNSWSLVGEHALGDESPLTTAERGIAEELGITNHNIGNSRQHKQAPVMEVSRLLPYPIYYRRHYGPTNGNRIDRQLTYLWWVRLLRPYQELNDMLTLDEEVADLQWVSLPDLRSWVDRDILKRNTNGSSPPPHLDFCHHTIQELLLLVLDSFESILTNNDNPSS